MSTRKEPRWLTRQHVEAIHDAQLATHGGLGGVRDAGGLEAALGRAPNRWHYRQTQKLPELAAAYGFAITKSHPFNDGNKRTALVAMLTFLEWNGRRFDADESEVVAVMLGVSDGSIPEADLARWLTESSKTRKRKK